jgi:putative intracellular protease/amidase
LLPSGSDSRQPPALSGHRRGNLLDAAAARLLQQGEARGLAGGKSYSSRFSMNDRSVRPPPLGIVLSLLGLALRGGLPDPARAADPPRPAAQDQAPATPAPKNQTLGIVLYPNFELLDVCGPAEMFGALRPRVKVIMVAQSAGPVASTQGPKLVADHSFDDCPDLDLILVPGGFGTRRELANPKLLDWLRQRAGRAEIVMSVCTGSAVLAKAGLLDGRRATSNKQYFRFAVDQGPKVHWIKQARWVDDGDRVTSSGVSAGIDMALHVIARLYGEAAAQRLSEGTEYQWHQDANQDPFAKFAR